MHTCWQCHLIAQLFFFQFCAHESKWIVGIICNTNSTSTTYCVEKLATFVKSFARSSIITSRSSCSVRPNIFNSSKCPMNGPLIHNYIRCIGAQNMSTYRIQIMTTLKGNIFQKKCTLQPNFFMIVSSNCAIT